METKAGSKKTFLFVSAIIFGALFSGLFVFFKENSLLMFDTMVKALPIYQYVGSSAAQTQELVTNYGVYLGVAFMLLYLVIILVLLFLMKILTLVKYQTIVNLIILIASGAFFSLGVWLMYFEPRVMPISLGVILFVGKPLLIASGIMLAIGIINILLGIFKKVPRVPNNVLLLGMLFFLGGCMEGCSLVGTVMNYSCDNVEDKDHCYQKAAISSNNPDYCEKIAYGPPRDKCHMMIAMNTGDYSYCEGADGVSGGYSQEFCESKVAEVSSGSTTGTGSETLSGSLSDSGSLSLTGIIDDEDQKTKNEELRENKDKIFDDVEDDDVKVEIAKQFNDYRRKNQDKSSEEWTKELNNIAIDVQMMKSLDDNANKMLDDLKSGMVGYVNSKTDEAKNQALEAGWDTIKNSSNTKALELRITQLEGLKGAYGKASEHYNFINEKLESIKKIKAEMEGIYKRIDTINSMVKNDKISEGQAQALRGAIFLDESLKRITGYVPVFGSTISTISDETFNVVVKFASGRAQRTHKLQKCLDDPDNCDANGISAY